MKELRAACLSRPGQEPDRLILEARLKDQDAFEQACRNHIEALTRLAKLTTLARGILAGDPKAYKEALLELNTFGEVAELGTTLHFSVHNSEFLGVDLKVKGTQVIPDEIKSLTSTGKLSVKRMPKTRFHEIYHDYVAGCMLRVAREVFALLPIKKVLITAIADIDNPANGSATEHPVLSVVIPRSALAGLDFERLDPSDLIDKFQHRGDFKASRKTGAFTPTVPFSPQEHIGLKPANTIDYASVLASVQLIRQELRASISKLNLQPPANPN